MQIDRNMSFSLGYFGDDLGLEVLVDMSDFFIYALVFRNRINEIPVGYVDEHGHRQEIYIQEASKDLRNFDDTISKQIQRLGGNYKNCRLMAALLAKLIEQGWPLIATHFERIISCSLNWLSAFQLCAEGIRSIRFNIR